MLSVVRSVADYAVKYEWATIDFGAHLSAEFTVRTAIHKPYTHEEIQKLWQDSREEAAQFALITIYTGMRPSELLSAHITDMDIEAGYITAGMKTEAGKDRIIPLHPDILGILRYWTDRKPVRLGTFRDKVWLPYINKTGLDHKPHDGRHTCATLMEAAGIPQNRRKLILGHAITDVTDGVYTHVSPEILIEEIKKIKP
jgi:integrase